MNKDKPILSLVSIVKNEEAVLQRMIDSVKDIVNEFIIVDTGSTDSTRDIISKYGKVYEIPFENYVVTKNKALALATGEYILFMDADEVLYEGSKYIREWVDGGNFEALECKITEGPEDYSIVNCEYNRIRVWRNDGKWKYSGPNVHEAIGGPSLAIIDYRILVRHDHHGKDYEKTAKEKYLQWEQLLVNYLENNPNDPRALFYLARTRSDLGKSLDAISTYMEYLNLSNLAFKDEEWQAHFDIAILYKNLGEFNLAVDFCHKAELVDSRRCEHLNLEAEIYFIQQDYEKAIPIYEKSSLRRFPIDVSLFINRNNYQLVALDQLVLCYYHTKQYDKAEDTNKRLISISGKHDTRILNNMWWCRTKTKQVIFMNLGITPEPIWGGMFDTHGIGGVETTYISLSQHLADMGHDVFLFCNTESSHVYNEVNYIKYNEYNDYIDLNPEVMITSRWLGSFDNITDTKKILWLQDASPIEAGYDFDSIDMIIVSSRWHSNYLNMITNGAIPKSKLKIIPLGISKSLFEFDVQRDRNEVIYSSNPNRGLSILADMWPKIVSEIPKIKLTVTYGWDGLKTWNNSEDWQDDVDRQKMEVLNKLRPYDVDFTGNITKRQLADRMMRASVLVYPCNFYETFCLTALEAQAAGTVIVTSNMGALGTTVYDESNFKISGSPFSKIYQDFFIHSTKRLLTDDKDFKLRSVYNKSIISSSPCDWYDIAIAWQAELWRIL